MFTTIRCVLNSTVLVLAISFVDCARLGFFPERWSSGRVLSSRFTSRDPMKSAETHEVPTARIFGSGGEEVLVREEFNYMARIEFCPDSAVMPANIPEGASSGSGSAAAAAADQSVPEGSLAVSVAGGESPPGSAPAGHKILPASSSTHTAGEIRKEKVGEELASEVDFTKSADVEEAPITEARAEPLTHHNCEVVCGGALVGETSVLTAAQCAYSKTTAALRTGGTYQAVLGDLNALEDEEGEEIIKGKFEIDPDFNILLPHENNLAVFQLVKPPTTGPNIEVISMGLEKASDFKGTQADVAGWGPILATAAVANDYPEITAGAAVPGTGAGVEEVSFSNALRSTRVTILNDEDCQQSLTDPATGVTENFNPETTMCYHADTAGTCGADMGSPIVVQEGTKKLVIGVVSFAVDTSGCSEDNVARFGVNLAAFTPFLAIAVPVGGEAASVAVDAQLAYDTAVFSLMWDTYVSPLATTAYNYMALPFVGAAGVLGRFLG